MNREKQAKCEFKLKYEIESKNRGFKQKYVDLKKG